MIIDIEKLTPEQITRLQVKYKEGKKHLKYFQETMKHFMFPERRLKTFDTKQYERELPEIERALKQLGKI